MTKKVFCPLCACIWTSVIAIAVTYLTNPTVHHTNIPQCTILKSKCAHMCTFRLQNGALCDLGLVHCRICEIGLLFSLCAPVSTEYLTVFMFYCLSHIQICFPWLMTWWRHQNLKWKHFPRYWPFVWGIHRSPVNSPHKGQWRRAFMFSLICAWINGWVNNGEADDLRRYRAHYDVTVMEHGQHNRSQYIVCGKSVCKGTWQNRKQHLRRENKANEKKYWYPTRYYDICPIRYYRTEYGVLDNIRMPRQLSINMEAWNHFKVKLTTCIFCIGLHWTGNKPAPRWVQTNVMGALAFWLRPSSSTNG